MKIIALTLLLINGHWAVGSKVKQLAISPTFSFVIPFELKSNVDIPTLNSKIFYIKEGAAKNETQVLVVHNKPTNYATELAVRRYWRESKKQVAAISKNEKNFGCKRLSSRAFQCSRDVIQNDKFHSESFFWNSRSDQVLIRVSSVTSLQESRELLNQIKVNQDSRLPTEVTK